MLSGRSHIHDHEGVCRGLEPGLSPPRFQAYVGTKGVVPELHSIALTLTLSPFGEREKRSA